MSIRLFRRLKISEVLVLTSMVVIGAIILLHDVLSPIPGVSAGPVPTMTGQDCHEVEAPGSLDSGFAVEGPDGLLIRVRVPANYDARRAYPLLVVYPPAEFDRFAAERYYGVTEKATQRGWIVAFSDARPLSMHTTQVQAHVADVVAGSFCIARGHIAYFGHSDGGALAEGILSLVPPLSRPRAIFASAAGITRSDLETYGCIARVSVMIAHNHLDDRFPGFGVRRHRIGPLAGDAAPSMLQKCQPIHVSGFQIARTTSKSRIARSLRRTRSFRRLCCRRWSFLNLPPFQVSRRLVEVEHAMLGLMQYWPLLISTLIAHAGKNRGYADRLETAGRTDRHDRLSGGRSEIQMRSQGSAPDGYPDGR